MCWPIRTSAPSSPRAAAAYTWCENAHEFRLTPWDNDPVSDPSGEAFYLRDEETGRLLVAHAAAGARRGRLTSAGTASATASSSTPRTASRSELWVYVAIDAPVKFSVLKVRNDSGRPRRLSATGYCEWVLGDLRAEIAACTWSPRSTPNAAPSSRATRTTRSSPTGSRSSTRSEPARTVTGDRTEFLGRNGTPAQPRGHDAACGCPAGSAPGSIRAPRSRSPSIWPPGKSARSSSSLGVGQRRRRRPATWSQRFRGIDGRARGAGRRLAVLEPHAGRGQRRDARPVAQRPGQRLAALPDAGVPPLGAQRLLPVGGAFGFRDQLQDAMALHPRRAAAAARASAALRAHGSSAKATCSTGGIRPRAAACARTVSDDYLWLPLATCRYVAGTGDTGVLDEARPLPRRPPGQRRRGVLLRPARTLRRDGHASTSTACAPILHGLRFGEHGLPLMGSRRLERRHEPGRQARQGRKRLAGILPLRRARRSSPTWPDARGDAAFAERCRARGGAAAREHRAARLGRRVVPPRLLRRRHAARLGGQPECQIDSIAAELVGAFRRRRRRSARARRWRRWIERLVRRDRRPDPAARPAVRQVGV